MMLIKCFMILNKLFNKIIIMLKIKNQKKIQLQKKLAKNKNKIKQKKSKNNKLNNLLMIKVKV